MRTLSETATMLFLALAARHVGPEPMLADAAALVAGRTRKWAGWSRLSEPEQLTLAVALRLRPATLAQPKRFVIGAEAILKAKSSPFVMVEDCRGMALKENDRYRLKEGLNIDRLIGEHFEALKTSRQPLSYADLPAYGDITLRHYGEDRIQVFQIPESKRSLVPPQDEHLRLPDAAATPAVSWAYASLETLAIRLDAAEHLHNQHLASLRKLWHGNEEKTAASGEFYRVNAPTGTGKSVLMVMMSIDAAQRHNKVVVAVPSLVEVDHTVEIIRRSIAATFPSLKVSPLHSMSRVAERAELKFVEGAVDHPYDYSCLLGGYATDLMPLAPGKEPCFNLQVDGLEDTEGNPKLKHCPFLFTCGRTHMLSTALDADIIVVNHHSLLSATTRIPLADAHQFPGSRSLVEILLRYSPVFLVDEIDGLLKSAIDGNVYSLQLGNIGNHSPLMRLQRRVAHQTHIPGVEPSSLYRVAWALSFCIISVNQLMSLEQRQWFLWPKKETTWSDADDQFIIEKLGIDQRTLDDLYDAESFKVSPGLRQLKSYVTFWKSNNQDRRPEAVAQDLGDLLRQFSEAGKLPAPLSDDNFDRLKASLILRGTLHFIESSLRTLNNELPSFVTANVPYAYEVQRSLSGPEPLSPTPIGPLHREVFGFKRKQTGGDTSSLNVVAMRGDPHGTLLALPELTALGYASTKRTFIGFSATAFFPGASAYDLKARDLIDVPDAKGQVTFLNLDVESQISGAKLEERPQRIRSLAAELWPWLQQRLAILRSSPDTENRARLLLVTSSDADAELLAYTLARLQDGPGAQVGWVRGRGSQYKPTLMKPEEALIYDELALFTTGKHKDKTLLVSALQPIARGHNIVNSDGLSAIGGVVVCVRPLPSSDSPENNLAHICYETGNTIRARESPGEAMFLERRLSNGLLQRIRTSTPAFSQQPRNIRHYTMMNILVSLTQLIGRGRRGGTPIVCYFADAAFMKGDKTSWAGLLAESVATLKRGGDWAPFKKHHAGVATAVLDYIQQSKKEVR